MQSTTSRPLAIGFMQFYTEAPITSFFPRITASKKRKAHTELAPSVSVSNRRRKDSTKDDEQAPCNSLNSGILHSLSVENPSTAGLYNHVQQTTERHLPLLPSSDVTSQTPKPNALPLQQKHKTSLQTPPPTNAGAEKQRLVSRKSLGLHIDNVLLPIPSTFGRSASYHNGHSGHIRRQVVQGHQDSSPPTPPQHSNTSPKASIPVSIPSSQSQLMGDTYSEDKHHLTHAGTTVSCRKLQLSQYTSSSNGILLNRRDKGDSTSYASQIVISSSQSQFLSPLDDHDSLRRSYRSSIAFNPELEIIPSSQSQEKEIRISSDLEEFHQSIHSRKQTLPQRTLSDELFSVSIMQTSWSDGSLDEQSIQATDIPCGANHGDDSATESETEPETEERDSNSRDHCLMQSQPYQFSQLSNGHLTSPNQPKDSRYSQQSSPDLSRADQTSSIGSLPGVVKEFQSMFGSSDDESYPPDFPMSLR